MVIVVVGRGESRVKVAVEVRIWNVASSIKCGDEGSWSLSGFEGLGFLGVWSPGVGISMEKFERARPRAG